MRFSVVCVGTVRWQILCAHALERPSVIHHSTVVRMDEDTGFQIVGSSDGASPLDGRKTGTVGGDFVGNGRRRRHAPGRGGQDRRRKSTPGVG